jgi:predicted DNA-binding protein
MARPRKGEEKDRPVHLGFRVSEETSEALRRLAEKRGSPMSDLVVEILEKGLRDAARADSRRGKAGQR